MFPQSAHRWLDLGSWEVVIFFPSSSWIVKENRNEDATAWVLYKSGKPTAFDLGTTCQDTQNQGIKCYRKGALKVRSSAKSVYSSRN